MQETPFIDIGPDLVKPFFDTNSWFAEALKGGKRPLNVQLRRQRRYREDVSIHPFTPFARFRIAECGLRILVIASGVDVGLVAVWALL